MHSFFLFTYALTLLPVLIKLSVSLSLIGFLSRLYIYLPAILQGTIIFLTFLWGVIILPTYFKHRLRSFLLPWRCENFFRRHRLHYSLVKRCLCRSGQCPYRLNGSFFPSPCFLKHRLWRRRNYKARARHKRRRKSTPESAFFTNTLINNNLSHPHLIQDVSGATLEYFCDGCQYFLSFPRLMSKFNSMDHAQNVQQLCQRLAVLSDRSF